MTVQVMMMNLVLNLKQIKVPTVRSKLTMLVKPMSKMLEVMTTS